jgi:hypothetical protein
MVNFFNDADIPDMLSACGGVPIIIDGEPAPGHVAVVDYVDEVSLIDSGIGGVVGTVITALVQTSAYPNVRAGNDNNKASTIVFDGQTFAVRRRFKEGDGGTTRLWCRLP